jgi:SNF2 family DNA or RNA helicase
MAEFSNTARVDEADQYAYLESVEDRAPAARSVSSRGPLETTQLVDGMAHETGLFNPSQRALDMAALQEDRKPSTNKQENKKRRKINAKEMLSSKDEINDLLESLWRALQCGLHAGLDEVALADVIVKRTPKAILRSKRPLHLRDYQLHAVNRILSMIIEGLHGALLACGMGLGKTLIVIGMVLIMSVVPVTYMITAVLVTLRNHLAVFQLEWKSQENTEFKAPEHKEGGFLFVLPKDLLLQWKEKLCSRIECESHIIVYRE